MPTGSSESVRNRDFRRAVLAWENRRVSKRAVENVLAQRYASPEMVAIWSPEDKIIAERRLWLAVLRAQRDLGIEVPDGAVEDYEAVIDQVDLASIAARERITRHDVKARIEEFNALAGHEQVHKGMTSRDLTENIEQTQILTSLRLIRDRCVAVLDRLGRRAEEYSDLVMAGRSHNVPAQATTLGKRFASAAQEVLQAYQRSRRPAGALPDARHQGPDGHLAGHARPARLGRGGGRSWNRRWCRRSRRPTSC